MTSGKKYVVSYALGMSFWALVFWLIGKSGFAGGYLFVAYVLFAGLVAFTGLGLYLVEGVAGYATRLRLRAYVTAIPQFAALIAIGLGMRHTGVRRLDIFMPLAFTTLAFAALNVFVYRLMVRWKGGADAK